MWAPSTLELLYPQQYKWKKRVNSSSLLRHRLGFSQCVFPLEEKKMIQQQGVLSNELLAPALMPEEILSSAEVFKSKAFRKKLLLQREGGSILVCQWDAGAPTAVPGRWDQLPLGHKRCRTVQNAEGDTVLKYAVWGLQQEELTPSLDFHDPARSHLAGWLFPAAWVVWGHRAYLQTKQTDCKDCIQLNQTAMIWLSCK